MNNYKHDTSKFSNSFIRPDYVPKLKMQLLKLKSTSAKILILSSKINRGKGKYY